MFSDKCYYIFLLINIVMIIKRIKKSFGLRNWLTKRNIESI